VDALSRQVRASFTCRLGEPAGLDPGVVGAKATNLARAASLGFPVLPAVVVTTEAHRAFLDNGRALPPELEDDLSAPWSELSAQGRRALVVRSSSMVEDAGGSSMAGQFRSVVDVRGWPAFLAAVVEVLRSADRAAAPDGIGAAAPSPMAVLVQPLVAPVVSGVMFGVDPVTGDRRSVVVEVVRGAPGQLVSGRVTAQRLVLSRRGRLRSIDGRPASSLLTDRGDTGARPLMSALDAVRLARLARRLERAFGSPQDAEWAMLDDGRLALLQARPVTATATDARLLRGPVLGPGPLAETFPDPLSPLEVDLWLAPLRRAAATTLGDSGAVPRSALEQSPVVTAVGGRVAVDLELFGYVDPQHRHRSPLDPRPAVRALRRAWRNGTLRAELPNRAETLVRDVDAFLVGMDLRRTDPELVTLLERARDRLCTVHAHEVLAGTLLPPATRTAAGMALGVAASLGGVDAPRAVQAHPLLLVLTPPALTGEPSVPVVPVAPTAGIGSGPLPPREQLRVRARWLQELTVRVVRELGHRWHEAGLLRDADDVCLLRLDELRALGLGAADVPPDLHERRLADISEAFGAPLPARFRLAPDNRPVAVERHGARPGGGIPASGGRAVGTACHGTVRHPPSPGDVLVVRHLEPGLAPLLPRISGLVSETGSTLSHLAILAREYGVPTVVGVHAALQRFPAGTRLLVDGSTGDVQAVTEDEP
jgi:phosphohistidine swiveling domain-containing protein